MSDYAILGGPDGHEVVPASYEEGAAWEEASDHPHRVAETTLEDGRWVSTIFYRLNLNPNPEGRPLHFETGVFLQHRSPLGDELLRRRYETWAEAEAGHAAVVAELSKPTASG